MPCFFLSVEINHPRVGFCAAWLEQGEHTIGSAEVIGDGNIQQRG